jgi:hypothetical protein
MSDLSEPILTVIAQQWTVFASLAADRFAHENDRLYATYHRTFAISIWLPHEANMLGVAIE